MRYCFKKGVPLFAGKFLRNSSRTDKRLRNHEKAMMRPNIESSETVERGCHMNGNIECRGGVDRSAMDSSRRYGGFDINQY